MSHSERERRRGGEAHGRAGHDHAAHGDHGHGDHDHGDHDHGDHGDQDHGAHGAGELDQGHDHAAHHGHGHHGHSHAQASTRALSIALVLTGAFMFIEAGVGLYSGGLALLADAAHMLSDAASLGLALFASVWAQRPRTHTTTFGHRRAEVLAAFLNGVALAVTALWIVVEAIERWHSPHAIQGVPMLVTASTGLGVNLFVGWILSSGGSGMNVRAALAHVAVDALGSIAAIASALAVLLFASTRADPVLSAVIAVLVAYSGWRVLRETTGILLEAAPAHIDVKNVERMILQCPGVRGVHDLHVWRISDEFDALTVHVTLAPGAHGVEVCRDVAFCLRQKFGLEHVTVQPEAPPPPELVVLRIRRDSPETAPR